MLTKKKVFIVYGLFQDNEMVVAGIFKSMEEAEKFAELHPIIDKGLFIVESIAVKKSLLCSK